MRISSSLLAQIERVDQLAVGVKIGALQVVKELAAARNHAEQAAAAVMILGVDLEVIREVIDAGRKKGHLDLGRASVAFGALELGNDLRLGQFRHGYSCQRDGKTCGHERCDSSRESGHFICLTGAMQAKCIVFSS